MRNIEYFDKQRGLINLLLFIEKNGKANISGIRNKGKINFGIAYKCLKIMGDMGLLTVDEEGFNKLSRGYKAKHYHLTEKGKKVAAVFNEIENGYDRSCKIEHFDNQTGLIKLMLPRSRSGERSTQLLSACICWITGDSLRPNRNIPRKVGDD